MCRRNQHGWCSHAKRILHPGGRRSLSLPSGYHKTPLFFCWLETNQFYALNIISRKIEQFRHFSSAVSFSVKNFYPSPYELNSSIIQEIINPQNDSTANFNLISYRENSQKKVDKSKTVWTAICNQNGEDVYYNVMSGGTCCDIGFLSDSKFFPKHMNPSRRNTNHDLQQI